MQPLPSFPEGPTGTGPQSIAAAERVCYHVLDKGFAALVADNDLVDRLFVLLDSDEKAKIKQLLTQHPPRVRHGYARDDWDVPQISIVVSSENETERFIGDALGADTDVFNENTGVGTLVQLEGSWVTTRLECWISSPHPDVTLYYYTMAWAMLRASIRDVFAPLNIALDGFSGGDMEPNPAYMPAYIFIRRISTQVSGFRVHSFDAAVWSGILVKASLQV